MNSDLLFQSFSVLKRNELMGELNKPQEEKKSCTPTQNIFIQYLNNLRNKLKSEIKI